MCWISRSSTPKSSGYHHSQHHRSHHRHHRCLPRRAHSHHCRHGSLPRHAHIRRRSHRAPAGPSWATHNGWDRWSRGEEEDQSGRARHDGPHIDLVVLAPPRGGTSTDGGAQNPGGGRNPAARLLNPSDEGLYRGSFDPRSSGGRVQPERVNML
jgi:hypothetical protein